jgi:hypothetical protein
LSICAPSTSVLLISCVINEPLQNLENFAVILFIFTCTWMSDLILGYLIWAWGQNFDHCHNSYMCGGISVCWLGRVWFWWGSTWKLMEQLHVLVLAEKCKENIEHPISTSSFHPKKECKSRWQVELSKIWP